jgi:hypothetical protein
MASPLPPNLVIALTWGDYSPRTRRYATMLADLWETDRPVQEWAGELVAWECAHPQRSGVFPAVTDAVRFLSRRSAPPHER